MEIREDFPVLTGYVPVEVPAHLIYKAIFDVTIVTLVVCFPTIITKKENPIEM